MTGQNVEYIRITKTNGSGASMDLLLWHYSFSGKIFQPSQLLGLIEPFVVGVVAHR